MTSLAELTEKQLKTLVAHVACWKTARRAPTTRELWTVIGLQNTVNTTVTRLITWGLLTQDWYCGRRVRGSLRPTPKALELLDAYDSSPSNHHGG